MIYKHCQKILLATAASTPFFPLQAETPAQYPSQFSSSRNISHAILDIFQEYVLRYDIEKKSAGIALDQDFSLPDGFDGVLTKIQAFVLENKPILLTIVGFPYKSSNVKDKVLSTQADGAERHALTYLQGFLTKIKSVYPPGAKLTLFVDGFVFCDIEGVPHTVVARYEDDLKTLAKDLPDICIQALSDLCPGKTPLQIQKLLAKEEPSFDDFKTLFNNDEKLQEDVRSLVRWLASELVLSNLSDQDLFGIALKETHQSRQYSQFLKKFRPPETIACSIRYQKDVSKKVGLKLSDSSMTPWNGVLVDEAQGSKIVHLNDVDHDRYVSTTKVVNGLSIVFFKRRR